MGRNFRGCRQCQRQYSIVKYPDALRRYVPGVVPDTYDGHARCRVVVHDYRNPNDLPVLLANHDTSIRLGRTKGK